MYSVNMTVMKTAQTAITTKIIIYVHIRRKKKNVKIYHGNFCKSKRRYIECTFFPPSDNQMSIQYEYSMIT